MSNSSNWHLLLAIPEDWGNEQKGSFYEGFVSELLSPMRLRPVQRLRVTGMELDILAKGEDQPISVLVECKAYRDPVSADVITKLLGNVQIRKADQGWLFTTSDLTKDGRGLWEEIQADKDHARRITWYSPSRTIDVLLSQKSIVHPLSCAAGLHNIDLGDWSLVITPSVRAWLVEVLQDGLPHGYAVFCAKSGTQLDVAAARDVARASPRFSALKPINVQSSSQINTARAVSRLQVARVVPGDAWEDPRPARPADFVGREDVIDKITSFIQQVRNGDTATRSFAVIAPSGWGKSSLSLKLVEWASKRAIQGVIVTAVDSRSAANAAFVSEALRLAISDAVQAAGGASGEIRIQSIRDPIDSGDVESAVELLIRKRRVCVLLFDQFEELFAKESLFEVFNAVRDLALDLDARQIPVVLGFAWKTDVSLPQQHPAYHLWHQLADRRRTFKVGEFRRGDIERIISKAESAIGKKISRPLRSRLAEQCQGLPWLLKKLLVHVLQRVTTQESQYLLLERELDIEQLFKDDLAQLKDEHLRCLKFVAGRAPIPVAEVEETFSRDVTNLLINQHLLVRSGMNYVVYWDIFRDYLVEERVPQIPWARTFQRMPRVALKALEVLAASGPQSAATLGKLMSLKDGPSFNLLGDLVSLQLVDADGYGQYGVAKHLGAFSAQRAAEVVRNQLRRHVVARAIERDWGKDDEYGSEEWLIYFAKQLEGNQSFSNSTIKQYAGNFKSWMLFAGLLELSATGLSRSEGLGAQMGLISPSRTIANAFLGASSVSKMEALLDLLYLRNGMDLSDIKDGGLTRAVNDAGSLGLITISSGRAALVRQFHSREELIATAKISVMRQSTVKLACRFIEECDGDRSVAASRFAERLGVSWKPISAQRNLAGLLRFAQWAGHVSEERMDDLFDS